MVASSTSSSFGRDVPAWLCILLGLVFVALGIIVLGDVVFATVASALVIGVCALVAGVFEIVHAFWTKGWGGFLWQIVLGLLYIGAGVVLTTQPVAGALVLTWLIGVVILVSGLVRIFLGFRNWGQYGWLLLVSGIFGVIAGFVILSGWPVTGIWVIGFLVGIDLIAHGAGWLSLALSPTRKVAT